MTPPQVTLFLELELREDVYMYFYVHIKYYTPPIIQKMNELE